MIKTKKQNENYLVESIWYTQKTKQNKTKQNRTEQKRTKQVEKILIYGYIHIIYEYISNKIE